MSDERTMLPTAKRRQLARSDGRVAFSRQISAAAMLVAASVSLTFLGSQGVAALTSLFQHAWSQPWLASDAVEASGHYDTILISGAVVLPVAAGCFVIAIVTGLAQVGFLWVPQRVVPDPQRLNPRGRIGTVLSLGKLVDAAQGSFLIAVVLGIAGWAWWSQRESLMRLALEPTHFAPVAWLGIILDFVLPLSACVAFFAAIDYAIQRYRFELSLHMTPEEMRAEIQAVQGNPQVAAGYRERQREVRATQHD